MKFCRVLARTETIVCQIFLIFSESSQMVEISILPCSLSERRVGFFAQRILSIIRHTLRSVHMLDFTFPTECREDEVISFFKSLVERCQSFCLFFLLNTSVHTIIQCIRAPLYFSSMLYFKKRAENRTRGRLPAAQHATT